MKTLKQFLNTNNDKNKVFLEGTAPSSSRPNPNAQPTSVKSVKSEVKKLNLRLRVA